jgi:DNA-binding NtrC family response regulator
VIQTREFFRIGGTKPILTNIRVITAMNADPQRAIEEGTFRLDLYYRVAVVMLRMPPLRERKEDIPLLVEHFLRRFSVAYHKPVRAVSQKALDRMMQLKWPGNVRQLENFIEQAFVLAEGNVLTESDLFFEEHPSPTTLPVVSLDRHPSAVYGTRTLRVIEAPAAPPAPGYRPSVEPRREPLGEGADTAGELEPGLPLREVERRHILRTLQAARGNRREAARSLGISIRALQYKLKFYLKANDPAALDAGA